MQGWSAAFVAKQVCIRGLGIPESPGAKWASVCLSRAPALQTSKITIRAIVRRLY